MSVSGNPPSAAEIRTSAAQPQLACRSFRGVEGQDERAPRAAVLLTARAEALPREQEGGKAGRSAGERERIFVFGGPKPKIFPWKRAEDSRWRLVAGVLARSARTPNLSLPAFPPSCCFLLDRTRWPEAATEASAIRAAVWQPKMCTILSNRPAAGPRRPCFEQDARIRLLL